MNVYTDEEGYKLKCPVVPFSWVIKKIEETKLPVEWQNEGGMYYVTCYDRDNIVISLRKDTIISKRNEIAQGWLRR